MNSSDTTANPAHGGLFVIACPLCFGHVAASAATAGQPVCCPLCAGMFVVPVPAVARAENPPPRPEAIPAPAVDLIEPTGIEAPPVAEARVVPPPAEDASTMPPVAAAPEPLQAADAPAAPRADDPFAMLATIDLHPGETALATSAELQFQEPVKKVGHGVNAIELHRLTDEDRRNRRSRRNIMLLMVGAALLMMIVVVLGIPRRKR